MVNEYASLAEFKAYVGNIQDVIDDPLLELSLEAASRGVDEYCNRVFYQTAAPPSARDYVARHSRFIEVDDFHTITGLVVATDTNSNGTFVTTWVAADYQLEPLNGVVDGVTGHPFNRLRAVGGTNFQCSRYRRANVRVTAAWGWAAIPPAVHDATLALAKDIFKEKDSLAGVVGFDGFGAVRIQQSPALRLRLEKFRRGGLFVA